MPDFILLSNQKYCIWNTWSAHNGFCWQRDGQNTDLLVLFWNREWVKLLMKIVSLQVVIPQVTMTKMWIVQAFFIGNLILENRHLTSIVSGSTTISESTIQLTAAQPINKFPTFVTPEFSLPCSQ